MGMTRIQKLRREEFARAAHMAFCEHGVANTTFSIVAQKAGVAKSNVLHYFENKDELVESAFRYNALLYSREAGQLMRRAKSPWDRVYAVIEANFSPTNFQPHLISSWIFMCAEVQRNTILQRVQRVMNRRVHSNLVFALKDITTPEKANAAALTIALAIQGLWLRCGTEPGGISRQAAIDHLEFLLERLFPDDTDRTASRDRMAAIHSILRGD